MLVKWKFCVSDFMGKSGDPDFDMSQSGVPDFEIVKSKIIVFDLWYC